MGEAVRMPLIDFFDRLGNGGGACILAFIALYRLGDAMINNMTTSFLLQTGFSQSDIGVIPNRRSIFTEINTPTRIFEYLSQGKPVIAPRVPGIVDYFGPEDLVFFELGDADDLALRTRTKKRVSSAQEPSGARAATPDGRTDV